MNTLMEELKGLEERLIKRFDKDIGGVKKRLDEIKEAIHDLGNGKPRIEVRFGSFGRGNGNRKGKQKELN